MTILIYSENNLDLEGIIKTSSAPDVQKDALFLKKLADRYINSQSYIPQLNKAINAILDRTSRRSSRITGNDYALFIQTAKPRADMGAAHME
ncbi:hypothetical protein JXA85_07095, partial [Candidatus Woesearchaeota archaeon]|nr:hypothetical protein [Candidatus Woesearchaeota archaeon]